MHANVCLEHLFFFVYGTGAFPGLQAEHKISSSPLMVVARHYKALLADLRLGPSGRTIRPPFFESHPPSITIIPRVLQSVICPLLIYRSRTVRINYKPTAEPVYTNPTSVFRHLDPDEILANSWVSLEYNAEPTCPRRSRYRPAKRCGKGRTVASNVC